MRLALRYWMSFVLLLLTMAPVLAQEKKNDPPTPAPSGFREFFRGMFDDWTGYLFVFGIIALIALIGAYLYVKKKQSED